MAQLGVLRPDLLPVAVVREAILGIARHWGHSRIRKLQGRLRAQASAGIFYGLSSMMAMIASPCLLTLQPRLYQGRDSGLREQNSTLNSDLKQSPAGALG